MLITRSDLSKYPIFKESYQAHFHLFYCQNVVLISSTNTLEQHFFQCTVNTSEKLLRFSCVLFHFLQQLISVCDSPSLTHRWPSSLTTHICALGNMFTAIPSALNLPSVSPIIQPCSPPLVPVIMNIYGISFTTCAWIWILHPLLASASGTNPTKDFLKYPCFAINPT